MNKSVVVCTMALGLALGPAVATGWAAQQHGHAPALSAPRAAYPVGEVVSDAPLNVRRSPTVQSATVAVLRPGQRVLLNCYVRGAVVDGNPIWYWLQGDTRGYVSARYLHDHQLVRPC